MSVTTFRPDPKGAAGWLQIRLRRPHGAFAAGSKFYGVPASKADGSFYYTNLKVCSCPDYATRGQGCKHQRAVALHVERARAEQTRTVRQVEQRADDADHDAMIDLAFAALSPLAGPVVETVRPTRYDVLFPAEA